MIGFLKQNWKGMVLCWMLLKVLRMVLGNCAPLLILRSMDPPGGWNLGILSSLSQKMDLSLLRKLEIHTLKRNTLAVRLLKHLKIRYIEVLLPIIYILLLRMKYLFGRSFMTTGMKNNLIFKSFSEQCSFMMINLYHVSI